MPRTSDGEGGVVAGSAESCVDTSGSSVLESGRITASGAGGSSQESDVRAAMAL